MKNLDAAVVIPAHKEGKSILHTLASIGRSTGVEQSKIGIFVVINQTRNAVEEVTHSNRETAEVIRSLQERKMPGDLSKQPRKVISKMDPAIFKAEFGDVEISEQRAAEEFLDSGMKIREINRWEGSAIPKYSNVGNARHVGVWHAIPCLSDKGCPVLNTDADSYFNSAKISSIINILRDQPKVHGITVQHMEFSAIDFGDDLQSVKENKWALKLSDIYADYTHILEQIGSYLRGKRLVEKHPIFKKQLYRARRLSFWGCDTNFRASVYKKVQFSWVGFGEDTEFATEMTLKNLKIIEDEKSITAFSGRFSDRCDHGYGNSIAGFKDELGSLEKIKVFSTDKIRFDYAIRTLCFKLIEYPDFKIDELYLELEKLNLILTDEEKLIISNHIEASGFKGGHEYASEMERIISNISQWHFHASMPQAFLSAEKDILGIIAQKCEKQLKMRRKESEKLLRADLDIIHRNLKSLRELSEEALVVNARQIR